VGQGNGFSNNNGGGDIGTFVNEDMDEEGNVILQGEDD
jgi:hypothetical protein